MVYNGGILQDESAPQLSKTRFLSGLQRQKRVYLEAYYRELVLPISKSQQALFDSGNAVGLMARDLFPDGCLVKERHFEHTKAVQKTESLTSEEAVSSIYEAAFTFDGIRIGKVYLVHIDNSHVYDGGPYSIERLFYALL